MSRAIPKTIKNGFVWVVGCRHDRGESKPGDWHIQGVATEEAIAIEMCLDDTYFIGPLPVNTALPVETIQWVGLYYPLMRFGRE